MRDSRQVRCTAALARGGHHNGSTQLSVDTALPRAQEVVRIFRRECGARLHWGKAGWPQWGACFDGAREYPATWCHFGCAVHARPPACLALTCLS